VVDAGGWLAGPPHYEVGEPMNWEPRKTNGDHGGGAETDRYELAHGGNPPRAKDDPLSCLFRAIADRVERLVGQRDRAVREEGVELRSRSCCAVMPIAPGMPRAREPLHRGLP
jgi:hypothetical protein